MSPNVQFRADRLNIAKSAFCNGLAGASGGLGSSYLYFRQGLRSQLNTNNVQLLYYQSYNFVCQTLTDNDEGLATQFLTQHIIIRLTT